MGQPTNQSPVATPQSIHHFSHPHELQLIPPNLSAPDHCSGCKLPPTGIMYGCSRRCKFALHHSCAMLPHLITHPSHGGCHLSLLIAASYPGAEFNCDGCRRNGDGWVYHCTRCRYDLHVACASKPLKVRHHSHPSCELHLTFKNPYSDSEEFSCDVCGKIGSNQWLYRCNICQFDVHLNCTTASPPMLQHHNSFPAAAPNPHHHQTMHRASAGGFNYSQNQFVATPAPQGATGFVSGTGGTAGPFGMNRFQDPVNGLGRGYGSGMGQPYGVNRFQNPVNGLGRGYGPGMGRSQNNQPPYIAAAPGGLGSKLMMGAVQGLVEGASQGVGQQVAQSIIDGGDEDGGDEDDGGSDDIFSF